MDSAFVRRLGALKNTSSTVDLSNMDLNAVRRAAGRPAVAIPETVVASRTPPSVVRVIPRSTVERLGDVNEFTRQAREERPQGITFVNQLGEEPTIVPTETNTAKAAAQGDYAQEYLKTAGYKDADTMVDLQVSNTPRNIDQAFNAIDAAEDQQTGRVYQQLQRNEDLDLNQVEIMEERAEIDRMLSYEADAPINQVASQLPDGLPADQAEGLNTRKNILNTSAARFLEQERDVISRELQNEDLPVAPTRIENELAKRLGGSTASSYGPKYTARKQALELYAQTGDPQFLETVERYGLKPVTFDPDSEEITSLVRSKNIVNMPGVGEVSTASLRKPVITESTARQADEFIKRTTQEKLNNNPWLEGIASEVEKGKQEIYSERKQLAEQTGKALNLQLEQAKARGQGNTVRQLENQLGVLRNVYRNPELGQHREFGEGGIRQLNARLRGAQETNLQQIQELQKKYPTTLTNSSGEGSRLFGVLNEEGDFIPETMELRSERRMVDTAPKGGSGRGIAEYAAGSRNEYIMGNTGRPPLFQRVGQEDDVMTKKYRLVESAQPQSNLRDYHLETGGTADSFENDRTDTVSRAYTTPGGSREVLLYPTTETLIPARSQQHQTIPGKYVTSLIGRNQKLQGPPLKKVLPIVIQNKGETGVGSTIDRYGIRRDLDPVDDITLRPSEPVYTEDELRQEALRLALYDSYGDAPISRPSRDREQMEKEAAQSLGSQPKTLAGQQSINASEEIRRIQRSNPPAKAQALVSSFLQQLKGA
jgi:hypothetical protein